MNQIRSSRLWWCLLAFTVMVLTLGSRPAIGQANGSEPMGQLTLGSDGNFYGTTPQGGANGNGTVYKITPQGTFTLLYSFSALSSTGENTDGANPQAGLALGSDGNFYGTAPAGGANGAGTVFKITPQGQLTPLHTFSDIDDSGENTDGTNPIAGLTLGSDGNFYGTASAGGTFFGCGTVFKITPQGKFTTLHSFVYIDGFDPEAALVFGKDGDLYGTTVGGGAYSVGSVFKITVKGSVIWHYSFSTEVEYINYEGIYPVASLLQASDGNFYGTTPSGGIRGGGTVYRITPAGKVSLIYAFGSSGGSGGGGGGGGGGGRGGSSSSVQQPTCALVQGKDGNLYGTATEGGAGSSGVVFKMTVTGHRTILYSFGTNTHDGANPYAGLTLNAADGNFYGTTQYGGASNNGTVFKITPAGTLTTIWSF